MSSRINQIGLVVVAIFALVGCQSAPRWAFWKHDTSPENASLVAKSTAPALPSTQSVPQSLAAASAPPAATNSIVGATPPSANSMAAALGTTPASISIPQTSPATTAAATVAPPAAVAATPTAYPSSSVTPYGGIAATKPAATTPPAVAAATPMTASPIATSGPYDPNAYRPASATSPASAPAVSLASEGSTDADRYGALTPSMGNEPDRYSMVPDAPLTAGAPRIRTCRMSIALPWPPKPQVPPAHRVRVRRLRQLQRQLQRRLRVSPARVRNPTDTGSRQHPRRPLPQLRIPPRQRHPPQQRCELPHRRASIDPAAHRHSRGCQRAAWKSHRDQLAPLRPRQRQPHLRPRVQPPLRTLCLATTQAAGRIELRRPFA